MPEILKLTIDSDAVATILFDLPGKPVNTMTRQVWRELDEVLGEIERKSVRGVIVASNKPKVFVAGADLGEIRAMSDDELRAYLAEGQRIYATLETLPAPSVAVINGDALGGGLELALACGMRIAADDSSLQIGLPETKVGLIPGWGGTVRLPRLIGLSQALPLMLSGKSINGVEAQKLGLVDRVVVRDQLLAEAKRILQQPAAPRTPLSVSREDSTAMLDKARADHVRKFDDHFPAPLRLIEVVRDACDKGPDAGFAGEIQGLIDMRNTETGRNLLRGFFMKSAAKKDAARGAGGTPREVKSVVVIGGGTMGSGIAHALVKSGIGTTIVEARDDLASAAKSRVQTILDADVKGGRMLPDASVKASALLKVATTPDCAKDADLVIEAIVEQLPAKIDLFRTLDAIVREDAILASNTSSLSITELAGATLHPSRVVGIHFFNPVPRMPLVEVVRTKLSDPNALATAVALASKLGKTPVVCNDSPGFIVNRVLFPQLHEACRVCDEGFDIVQVDSAIKRWGMPMGPFELMDEIGLDVTVFILQALQKSLGGRFAPPAALTRAVESGFVGKKAGKGYYVHSKEKGVAPVVNADVMKLFNNSARSIPSDKEIQNRVMNPMAAEANQLLSEGVVDNPESIDVATIMGLGFANFRGGLATWMKSLQK
jgi:3-hydroxyacyl-CoA dehydrogenase/enoyl-CoA hydratase/3-hydroxybutyryl-CoA epimerase